MSSALMALPALATALGLGALAALSGANLAAVLLLGLALPAAHAVWRGRLDTVAAFLLFLAITVDDPRGRPYMGMWEESPLRPLGNVLLDSLGKSVGVESFKVFGIELCLAALGVMVLVRRSSRAGRAIRPARPLIMATVIAGATVLLLEAWGMLRGGNLRFSMLQMRPMFMLCVSVLIFAHTFTSQRSPKVLMGALLGAGWVRAWVGIYFWRTHMLTSDEATLLSFGGGGYITSHADSVIWVTGLVICIGALLEHPSLRTLLLNLVVVPPLAVAIVANNRRVAAVCMVLGLVVLYAGARMLVRRRIHRLMLGGAPLLACYIGAAWTAEGAWAAPVRTLQSVANAEDASASMRDIENYNLLRTARRHLVLGSGLGHEYEEEVVAISIADLLEAYRYMPHNSLLWLVGAGGLIGTLLFWLLFPVGVFVAIRYYDASTLTADRVAALTAITTVTTYGTQSFADMGMHGWMPVLVTSAMLGLVAARASAVGAWRT